MLNAVWDDDESSFCYYVLLSKLDLWELNSHNIWSHFDEGVKANSFQLCRTSKQRGLRVKCRVAILLLSLSLLFLTKYPPLVKRDEEIITPPFGGANELLRTLIVDVIQFAGLLLFCLYSSSLFSVLCVHGLLEFGVSVIQDPTQKSNWSWHLSVSLGRLKILIGSVLHLQS